MNHAAVLLFLLSLIMVCVTPGWGQEKGKELRASARVDLKAWAPPEVSDASPASGSDCPLQRVLTLTGERVRTFVEYLPQFTATERLEHQQLRKGKWSAPEIKVFEYLAELREIYPGMLQSQEFRNGTQSLLVFPAGLADLGLPSLVLAFHPYFAGDYTMTCEGPGEWHGQAVWKVHFQQRPDRAPRLRAFNLGPTAWYPLRLKGRAWIAADNYQVLHMETDLLLPVPQIRLLRDHVAVDYRPVRFSKSNVELWLPEAAEIYMDFAGRRYRRRHTFSDFLLFSVDVNQKVVEPKAPDPD